MEVVVTGHNFESILPKDHPCHVCFKLADWFQKRRLLNNFPIGSYVKTMSADGGHFEPRSGSLNTILEVDHLTAGNRHKQKCWFCKEIREDNFRFWWRRVHEDASQGMYMSKIEIFFFTALILQNQRMLCCGECFHD